MVGRGVSQWGWGGPPRQQRRRRDSIRPPRLHRAQPTNGGLYKKNVQEEQASRPMGSAAMGMAV